MAETDQQLNKQNIELREKIGFYKSLLHDLEQKYKEKYEEKNSQIDSFNEKIVLKKQNIEDLKTQLEDLDVENQDLQEFKDDILTSKKKTAFEEAQQEEFNLMKKSFQKRIDVQSNEYLTEQKEFVKQMMELEHQYISEKDNNHLLSEKLVSLGI